MRVLILSISLSIALLGCASYTPGRLPSSAVEDYPNSRTQEKVTVAVDVMSGERTKAAFDSDLLAEGIQPVYLVIDNRGDKTFRFAKASVDKDYVPTTQVYEKSRRCTGCRAWGYGLGGLILWPLLIPAIADSTQSSSANDRIRADLVTNEISDGAVGPNKRIYGVLFLKSGSKNVRLPMSDEDGRLLVFEFNQ